MRLAKPLGLGLLLLAASVVGARAGGDQWKKIGKIVSQAAELRDELKLGRDNEMALGREVADLLISRYGLYPDEELTRYVGLVGLTVSRHAKREGLQYRFGILDTDDVNAFAAPGGYVFVTRGLLQRLKSEGQLAGILGHEITHVDHKHALNAIIKMRALGEATKLAFKKSQVNDLAKGIVDNVLEKGLDKTDEYDADAGAVPLAAAAGYRPSGLSDALKGLFGEEADQNALAALTSTHPSTESRLQRLRKVLAQTPKEGGDLAQRWKQRVKL